MLRRHVRAWPGRVLRRCALSRSVRQSRRTISRALALRRAVGIVAKTTDALTPLHAAAVRSAFNTINQFVAEPLMVAFAMIVNKELGEDTTEVPLPQWNTAVQASLLDSANKPLSMCIAVRRAERCPDHAHPGPLEQGSNSTSDRGRKSGIACSLSTPSLASVSWRAICDMGKNV